MSGLADYLTTAEAARVLGVSRQRIAQYVESGRLEAVRFGVVLAIPRRAVEGLEKRPVGRPSKKEARK